MTKQKAIRRFGCKNIDFVGNLVSDKQRDEKLSREIIEEIATKEHRFKNIPHFCKNKNWLDTRERKSICSRKIPYFDMVSPTEKQYVIGRMQNLKDYYECQELFYTLDTNDWDSLYQINDLFIYCAATSEENVFPIRIVTKGSIRNKSTIDGISDYAVMTIPYLLNQWKKLHITARELCQISKYFRMHIYQSKEHPNIFFASKKKPSSIKSLMETYKLKHVVIS